MPTDHLSECFSTIFRFVGLVREMAHELGVREPCIDVAVDQ
jgi:hypothetical protein